MPAYRNRFREPAHTEIVFEDTQGQLIGTLRIKPNTIAWKRANAQRFKAVDLGEFRAWIESPESNSRTRSS